MFSKNGSRLVISWLGLRVCFGVTEKAWQAIKYAIRFECVHDAICTWMIDHASRGGSPSHVRPTSELLAIVRASLLAERTMTKH